MTEQEIKETAAESALSITKNIGTIQLIGVVAIALSPFILIWGSWQLSGKIALTGMLVVLLMWFTNKVVLSIFEDMVKDNLKKKENKPRVMMSRWQQKLEDIQEKQKRANSYHNTPHNKDVYDNFSDELDKMLRGDYD